MPSGLGATNTSAREAAASHFDGFLDPRPPSGKTRRGAAFGSSLRTRGPFARLLPQQQQSVSA